MKDNLTEAVRNRLEIADIKHRYLTGEIDRQTAKALAAGVIHRINEATVRITERLNRKYGTRHRAALVSFASLMR